jgi:methylmalonyl-CoA/ethylmalonyl-CoA epimerase
MTPATQPLGALIGNNLAQLAYVCPDLDRATAFFADKLGLRFLRLGEAELDGVGVTFALAQVGDLSYELMQPATQEGVFGSYLKGREDQTLVFHHVGLMVDDFDQASASVRAAGYEYALSDDTPAFRYGFIDTTPEFGHMLEVMQAGPDGKALYERVRRGDF